MNICGAFIRRPVMTTLVTLAILLAGLMGYRQLPVSDLPNVDFPTIQVSASLPGASPETMAASVALPLERQFSTIAGLDSMTSTSALGSTQVTLQFNLSRDIDSAAQDVQAAVAQAEGQLPPEMPNPPVLRKVNPADQPVLYLALSSPSLPLSQLDEYAQTTCAERISMVNGVAQVQVYGSQKYAVRVQLDPLKLASRGIGLDEVAAALRSGNPNLPTGTLYGEQRAYTVEATGQLTQAAAYRPLIVAYRDGRPVRLEELGRIIDGVENDKTASWYRDTRAIVLAIQRQPGTNTIEVVDAIKRLLAQIEPQLPGSVNLNVLYDRSASIRESVDDVRFTMYLTICLVVMVIFLFLRNASATLITSLALPTSIVGTFAVMYMLGFSLDNLSLMALTLSVGFVVDDAIVVLENIVRHQERGEGAMAAALAGSREIGFTVVSMTLSLAAVFIPVLFMGGIVGRLLSEFAVTIAAAIMVSGFISLTLTPMMCSRMLRPASERRGRLYVTSERLFEGMLALYERTLQAALRRRRLVMALLLALTLATAYLFGVVPKGFLPTEDTGQIFCFTEAAEGISFDAMVRHQRAVADVVLHDPYAQAFMSSVGGGGTNAAGNTGRMFLRLKPRDERPHVNDVIAELRPKLAAVPGIQVFPQVMPPIRIGGQLTKSLYQITLQSPDPAELYRAAPVLEEKMRQLPGLADVTSDLLIKNPQVTVEIDRDRSSALGVSAQAVEEALYSAYGAREVSTIYAPNNDYQVIMELADSYQLDPSALSLLYVRASSGKLVPLDAVARVSTGVGPLLVNHCGQLPAVTISFNLGPGAALGPALAAVEKVAAQIVPATVSTSFQGLAQAFQSSLSGLWLLLLASVLVIYIILGILYEDFLHPVTILSGLPAAGFGALVALKLFGLDLNLYAFVGLIMLVGIMKKNAIMMVDFAIEAQRQGAPPGEAIYQGCLIRFRPIMMTTMAALMGSLPIALGMGAGAESRRPLGLAVVGGLLVSQLLTLYVTPVFYTYVESLRSGVSNWRGRARQVPPHGQIEEGAPLGPAGDVGRGEARG